MRRAASKPTRHFPGRYLYETGLAKAVPLPANAQGRQGQIIALANAIVAADAVAQGPSLLLCIDAVVGGLAEGDEAWLLAWDLPGTEANVGGVLAGAMGVARYSWGPGVRTSGAGATGKAWIYRDPSEWVRFCDEHTGEQEDLQAFPFDSGIIIAASTDALMVAGALQFHAAAPVQQWSRGR